MSKSKGDYFPLSLMIRCDHCDEGGALMCVMRDGKVVHARIFQTPEAALIACATTLQSVATELAIDAAREAGVDLAGREIELPDVS